MSEESKPKTLSPNLFPVVGIGASAGGLDAFKRLLKAIPENSGIAYVLVQHLDPTHDSMLPEILQKVTQIPVLEISDDIKVKPDHIYILPSNKMLVANDGVLQLSPRITKKNERNLPIDLFFISLAQVHQDHAIGVVLSGTGSDGTKGLKSIKDHGVSRWHRIRSQQHMMACLKVRSWPVLSTLSLRPKKYLKNFWTSRRAS